MAKIIPLATFKQQTAIRDGFQYWHTLFDEPFDGETRLTDLRPETLSYLSEPGEACTLALHTMIIGFLGQGITTLFEELEPRLQCRVIDISLFVSDQIRFEMMVRLRWLTQCLGNQAPLFQMVTDFDAIKAHSYAHFPILSKNHRDYQQYAGLIERDQQVFIRRLFPAALAAFNHLYDIR